MDACTRALTSVVDNLRVSSWRTREYSNSYPVSRGFFVSGRLLPTNSEKSFGSPSNYFTTPEEILFPNLPSHFVPLRKSFLHDRPRLTGLICINSLHKWKHILRSFPNSRHVIHFDESGVSVRSTR